MTYASEFRQKWNILTAVGFGLGFGYMLHTYIAGIFAPQLIANFGWSKSQFALVGMAGLAAMVGMPVAGRLADRFGVKRVATVGVILGPLVYLCISFTNADFRVYMVLCVLQALLVAPATTTAVYSRLIAEHFYKARGSALALAACMPAAVGALMIPLLSVVIEQYDWRTAFRVVALLVALGGAVAVAFIPSAAADSSSIKADPKQRRKGDVAAILKNPAFLILIGGMFLCNLTLTAQATQMKLILLEQGLSSDLASWSLSVYAAGVLLGRFCCGAALDRLPSHYVAFVGLGLPGVGLLLLALAPNNPALLILGVILLGLSMGAELDIAGYLVMRFFDLRVYSTAYSLIAIGTAMSASFGSVILSVMLSQSDSFVQFLLMTGVITLAGSFLFLRLGKLQPPEAGA